ENLTWSFRRVPRSGVEQDQLTDLTTYVEGVVLGVTPDRWHWTLDGSGEFSVASARKITTGNLPSERRLLWVELGMHKNVARGYPWILMGDFNVALNLEVVMGADNVEVVGNHVVDVFVSHYQEFLGTNMARDDLHTEDLFSKKISNTTCSNMVRTVSDVEIKAAIFDIGDDRAPGIKEVVSDNQSTFVSGRRISDSILITQELMHNYHRDRGPPRCAFKVDIQKAYDTVDWEFLGAYPQVFWFSSLLIKYNA
ncbi:ribonuclease H-like domain-containing protein, partial [Tanacetum coccineum]